MWKLLIGFALFAAAALFILNKSGGDIDLGGEKHDVGAGLPGAHSTPEAKPAAPAATPAPAAPEAAPTAAPATPAAPK